MADDTQTPSDDAEQLPEDAAVDPDATPSAEEAPAEAAASAEAGTDGAEPDASGADAPTGEAASAAADPPPASAAPGAGDVATRERLAAEVLAAAGEGADVLRGFAVTAADVLSVGLETVVGQNAAIADALFQVTEYDAIQREYGALDHLGFELRVAISETEVQLVAALIPLADVGSLFRVDTSSASMDDADFAAAQLEPIAQGVRELLDLISLTLFGDGLAGAEVTLSEIRRGQVDWTIGMLQDVAQGAPPARVDFTVALQDGTSARVTCVTPISLLTRFAGLLGMDALSEDGLGIDDLDDLPGGHAGSGAAPENISAFARPDAESSFAAEGGTRGFGGGEHPVHPVRFPPLPQSEGSGGVPQSFELIMDVSMRVSVELGRSSMTVEEILELGPGSVVELNKLAGEPVDILVNDRLIARGEVVVVDENFGVRVTEIISPRQRASAMGR